MFILAGNCHKSCAGPESYSSEAYKTSKFRRNFADIPLALEPWPKPEEATASPAPPPTTLAATSVDLAPAVPLAALAALPVDHPTVPT